MFGGKSDVKFSGAYQQQMGCMFHKLLEFCAYPFGKYNSIHVMSLKEGSGRFFFHFREIFGKCIEYIGKFLKHFREILKFC